jgi:actin-like ATPase involved in cell morphogenesis
VAAEEIEMYQLGVDLGTTWSAAAVCRAGGRAPEPVALGEHANAVASAVYAGADGSFLLGEAAERRALSDPDRVVREFKRRIGDPTPLLVGREPVPAEVLAARFIAALVRQVSQREGGPPSGIAVTHPAGWGPHKVSALRAALAGHGVGPVLLLTEPQAAAVGYAATERVEPGSVVAVYDLGGGTFDAAVVRKDPRGEFSLLGTPEGIERLGGVDFDEAVFAHVRDALGPAWAELDGTDPAVLEAVARLRRECTAAKEGLSSDIVVHIPVMLPGLHTRVRLGRAEFEDMIRPAVADTVDALRRALDSAGVAPADLAALLLVGGSSRMPLVTELVSAGIGRPASVDADPKGVIAAGAALVARGAQAPAAEALAAHGAAAVSATDDRRSAVREAAVRDGAVRDATVRDAANQRAAGRAAGGGAAAGAAAGAGAAGVAASAVGPTSSAGPTSSVGPAGAGRPGGAGGPGGPGGTRSGGPRPGASGPGDRSADRPPTDPLITPVTASIRPPRPARPFSEEPAGHRAPRKMLAMVAAGVLALVLLGGAIAFASRPAPGAAASTPEPTPVSTVQEEQPAPVEPGPGPAPAPEEDEPAPEPRPGPAQPQVPPRTNAPPVTTQPRTTQPTTTEPTTTQPTTTEPTTTTSAAEGAAPAAGTGGAEEAAPAGAAPAGAAPAEGGTTTGETSTVVTDGTT